MTTVAWRGTLSEDEDYAQGIYRLIGKSYACVR